MPRNRMPGLERWTGTGGASFNSSTGVWTLPDGAAIASPIVNVEGLVNWTFTADTKSTAVSPEVTFAPQAGYVFGSSHFAADSTTPANNSAGWPGNGQAAAIPINTWTRSSWSNAAGGSVVLIKIQITNDSSFVGGTEYVRDVDLYDAADASATHLAYDPLLAYWPLDEPSGSTITDASGYGHTGTLYDAPRVAGKVGNAVDFDDAITNGRIDISTSSHFNIGSSDFTLSAWVKFESVSGGYDTIIEVGAYPQGVLLRQSAGNLEVWIQGANHLTAFPWAPATARWYHVACTRTAGTVRMYVDGVSIGTPFTETGSINLGGNIVRIGQSVHTTGQQFDGIIDEVRFYSEALSPADLLVVSAEGVPWTLDLMALNGASTLVSAATFQTARITWAADGSGAAEVELRPTDVEAGDWLYGQRRLAVRDPFGVRRYQGWLDRLERSGSPGAVKYRASSRGLASILDERVVHGDFSSVEQLATSAAVDLLEHIDAQTDDKTNFTAGTVTGVARTVTRYWCDGDIIAEAFAELSDDLEGFAWEIDADGAFNAWAGGRGSDLSGVWTLAEGDVNSWDIVGSTEQLATYATGFGDSDTEAPCGPPLVEDYISSRTTYGRREVVVESSAQTEAAMWNKTGEELRAREASRINLRVAWIEGRGPWPFGDVWIGDVVNAELGAPFGGDGDVRCTAITVTLERGTHVFIEMEFEAA